MQAHCETHTASETCYDYRGDDQENDSDDVCWPESQYVDVEIRHERVKIHEWQETLHEALRVVCYAAGTEREDPPVTWK